MSIDVEAQRDDRKSAALAEKNLVPPADVRVVTTFDLARDVLRCPEIKQDGQGAEDKIGLEEKYLPVFYLDGDAHKKRRQQIARFFTPKAIQTRYRLVMEDYTERIVTQFQKDGRADLSEISFDLTVGVAADIVGLTNSDPRKMAKRIEATLISTRVHKWHPSVKRFGNVMAAAAGMRFFVADVMPAIKARKQERKVDVISHLIDEDYPNKAIMIECMTYAVAGMVTTREFITMAAWHMFDNPELHKRFLDADEPGQCRILEEILRLEPVAAQLYRRPESDIALPSGEVLKDEKLHLSLREANLDESAVGACPHAVDPDRSTTTRVIGAYLSFGEGSHRCPGAQVAINESRVFLDRLMRVPGLALARKPRMTWNSGINSYELRRAIITCDRV